MHGGWFKISRTKFTSESGLTHNQIKLSFRFWHFDFSLDHPAQYSVNRRRRASSMSGRKEIDEKAEWRYIEGTRAPLRRRVRWGSGREERKAAATTDAASRCRSVVSKSKEQRMLNLGKNWRARDHPPSYRGNESAWAPSAAFGWMVNWFQLRNTTK